MNGHFVEIWHGDILSDTCLSKGIEDQRYWSLLNQEEQKKAQTFTRPELQRKYIKTRGALREILASYLDIAEDKIELKTAEHGKPFIANNPVHFNLSHTANKFVLAITNFSEVGVDLEQYKERKSFSGLVNKCFSEQERQYWYALPEDKKVQMFYRFWVRKEAFVKAVGRGIALGLDQCVINPDDHARFLNIPDSYGVANDWKIQDVELNENDFCALVVRNLGFDYKQRMLK